MDLFGNGFRPKMLEISFSGIDRIDFLLIEIKPKDGNARSGKLQRQRKTDIAKSNDRYFGKLFTQELIVGSELVVFNFFRN